MEVKACAADPLNEDGGNAAAPGVTRVSRCWQCCKDNCMSRLAPEVTEEPAATGSAIDRQVGGDHYKKLGQYQPWEVLKAWLTPEEFRGYMKGTVIAYLARERDKGGDQDIAKSAHTLEALVEYLERNK